MGEVQGDVVRHKKPVLIVIEGGIPDVQYCPPGVVVLTKDYDVECDSETCERPELHCFDTPTDPKDTRKTHFHLSIATHADSHGQGARVEGMRLMKQEKIR